MRSPPHDPFLELARKALGENYLKDLTDQTTIPALAKDRAAVDKALLSRGRGPDRRRTRSQDIVPAVMRNDRSA